MIWLKTEQPLAVNYSTCAVKLHTWLYRFCVLQPQAAPQAKPKAPEPEPQPEPESEESDVELDNTDVVDDPDDFMPEYPSMEVEVTEEMMDQASEKRSEAMAAMSEGSNFF